MLWRAARLACSLARTSAGNNIPARIAISYRHQQRDQRKRATPLGLLPSPAGGWLDVQGKRITHDYHQKYGVLLPVRTLDGLLLGLVVAALNFFH